MLTYKISLPGTFGCLHKFSKFKPTRYYENIISGKTKHITLSDYKTWEHRIRDIESVGGYIMLGVYDKSPRFGGKKQFITNLQRPDFRTQKLSIVNKAVYVDGKAVDVSTLAANEGLTVLEYLGLINPDVYSKPFIIIQLTDFMY